MRSNKLTEIRNSIPQIDHAISEMTNWYDQGADFYSAALRNKERHRNYEGLLLGRLVDGMYEAYEAFKAEISQYVGWNAKSSVWNSQESYEAVLNTTQQPMIRFQQAYEKYGDFEIKRSQDEP
jgi:hypothetical protein